MLSYVLCVALTLFTAPAMARKEIKAKGWEPPAFCKGLDCPPYTVERVVDGIELRKYAKGTWVSTDIEGVNYREALRKGFMTLFDYISGSNSEKKKIEMTAPVRTTLKPGPGPLCQQFTVSFFLPYEYQEAGNAPEPSKKGVYLDEAPTMEVYVGSYGGFSSEDTVVEEAGRVIDTLKKNGLKYDASLWYGAGYDAPFQVKDRHNEVWIPKA